MKENQRERFQNFFTSKNLWITQKKLHPLLNQTKNWHGVLKIDAFVVAKQIILSWPNIKSSKWYIYNQLEMLNNWWWVNTEDPLV